MKERDDNDVQPATPAPEGDDTLAPLPGEPGIPNVAGRRRTAVSKKGLLAAGLLLAGLAATVAMSIQRCSASGETDSPQAPELRNRPAAAAAEPRRLQMPVAPPSSTAAAPSPRVPALLPSADDPDEPIGVRRSGISAPTTGGTRPSPPEDAPILLVSTRPGARAATGGTSPRAGVAAAAPGPAEVTGPDGAPADPITATTRNLQTYQRQLQGLLDTLTKSTQQAAGGAGSPPPAGALLGGLGRGTTSGGSPASGGSPSTGGGLFGGQLPGSATPKVAASMLGNRSLTLPKGTAFTCALKTKVISATSGLVGCQVQRDVFSDDGRVLLIERGSHLDGEYRIASVRPGTVRIPVLWTRIRTPLGVTVDIDSPGTGQLGESGIDGHVDNRWGERIGAAMLLSLIDDSVKLVIQNQASGLGNSSQADTILLPSTTANTSKLAEKVLDSTINIPPLIYQNQGGIVGIYVARDVNFSSVYELKPTATAPAHEGTP